MAVLSVPAYSSAFNSSQNSIKIQFKHSVYSESENVLLSLNGFDEFKRKADATSEVGLHHGTVLIACGIVACNAFDGYFSKEKGGQKLEQGQIEYLTDSTYYFNVPTATNETHVYPICPSFKNWAFPHDNFSNLWKEIPIPVSIPRFNVGSSNVTSAVIHRDGGCLLSGCKDAGERVYLCPLDEKVWFKSNSMSQYNSSTTLPSHNVTEDISNAICLRRDIYFIFDYPCFVIVPKDKAWRPSFIAGIHELSKEYHNKQVQWAWSELRHFHPLHRLAPDIDSLNPSQPHPVVVYSSLRPSMSS